MPSYFKRLQFIEDSSRAHRWFELTKDSIYIKKYQNKAFRVEPYIDTVSKKAARRFALESKPDSASVVYHKNRDVPSKKKPSNKEPIINDFQQYGMTRNKTMKYIKA
jgi:hypothetical protein